MICVTICWQAIQEIRAANAGKDPEEDERDIAEAIAEVRAERRAAKAVMPER